MSDAPLPVGPATCAQCGSPLTPEQRELFKTYCGVGCSVLHAMERIAQAQARQPYQRRAS